MKKIIQTEEAPVPQGSYSQAIQRDKTIYLSGQIPINPKTGILIQGDITLQTEQIFENLRGVAKATGGTLEDIVKITVYMKDLTQLPMVNVVMARFFKEYFPARTSIGVAALPQNAEIEIDAIMVL